MNKIEREMCDAVKDRRCWQSGNTSVEIYKSSIYVKLFGNTIMIQPIGGNALFSTCGYKTKTTLSRLNALGCKVKKMRRKVISRWC